MSIRHGRGRIKVVRCLLDYAYHHNFISEALCERLQFIRYLFIYYYYCQQVKIIHPNDMFNGYNKTALIAFLNSRDFSSRDYEDLCEQTCAGFFQIVELHFGSMGTKLWLNIPV